MPKIIAPLTAGKVASAKSKDKLYKLNDGNGLALWVYPTGNRSWKLSYTRLDGKRDTLTLGSFPNFSLSEARQWRDAMRLKLAHGEEIKKPKIANEWLFENRLDMWLSKWQKTVTAKYGKQVENAIKANCLPYLQGKDVRQIAVFDIVQSLRGMENRGVLEYLRRTKTGLSLFFDDLVGQGLIPFNPVSAIGKRVFRQHEKKHFSALSPDDLPLLFDWYHQTEKYLSPFVRHAVMFQFLTMTRPAETAGAKWAEFDLSAQTWTIPPERMKRRKQHIVPLSSMAVAILCRIKDIGADCPFVFVGAKKNTHITPESIRLVLQRHGLNTTAHGLRALSATLLEENGFSMAVIDACLAHSKDGGNMTTQAYMRSSYFHERKKALDFLSDLVAKQ